MTGRECSKETPGVCFQIGISLEELKHATTLTKANEQEELEELKHCLEELKHATTLTKANDGAGVFERDPRRLFSEGI